MSDKRDRAADLAPTRSVADREARGGLLTAATAPPVRRLAARGRRAGAATVAAILVSVGLNCIPARAADGPCANPVNVIACENSKPGTPPSEWDDIWGAGDDTIQGFTTDVSVNVGQTVSFKIKAAAAYRIDIYRLGYYQGNGARKLATLNPQLGAPQPDCVTDATTEIYDCGTWHVSATWTVPSDAVSGVYLARLTRNDNTGASQTPFIVRNDASTSKVFFKTSDATWQAYNDFGGSNFYWGGPQGRALKVSYNRPYATRNIGNGRDFLFSNEFPMIRFLERNGYDVSYTTDVDAERRGDLIRNHKVFLSVGHDEYWSGRQRANVEAARDAGVNLAFFSGNEVYWKTRWEPSVDGANSPYRTLVCYKETWANSKIDPSTEWTGTWRDPRFTPPSDGGRPENGLTGTLYMSNNTDLAMQVPAAQGKNRFWRNTAVAALSDGQTATLAPHTVGYESDEDRDNGFRPPGLIRLSTTTGPSPEYLRDFGSTVTPGTTTHHMTLYRADSGALVFSAGTIQWAWGLDSEHDGVQSAADSRMQQATVNLLADMAAQPTTLMPGLVTATASTDTAAPTAVITTPANGASIDNGAMVAVRGTASDSGAGRVAGIEVSTDGGTTWHPADGTSTWSYTFVASGTAAQVVKARAIDDSGNIETSPASITLALDGPSSLFGQRVPTVSADVDGSAVTLGVKFTPQSDGSIVGVRFYKGTGNTGTHTSSIWSSSGQLLRTGTFGNETATGWQRLNFSSPLKVAANTTYIVSYFAPNGHYAADDRFFSYFDHRPTPLVAPRATTNGGNGVFRPGSGFPDQASPTDANYYVDVLFIDGETAPPTVLSTTPGQDETGVDLSARPQALFSKPLAPSSVQFTLKDAGNTPVAGIASYDDATRTVTFTPAADLTLGQTYIATVSATDLQGRPMKAPQTWSFTTTAYAQVSTLFAPDAVPGSASSSDAQAVTLGVKFTPAVSGKVIGVRYYQGPGNGGTHTGSIYSASGDLLARATFPASAGTGWRSVQFATPVQVVAGTTYVAAYWAPEGNYAHDGGFFGEPYTNDDTTLSAPAGSNGVYAYGSDTFPTGSYNSTNYWVDPMFVGDGPPPGPPPPPTPPANAITIFGSDTPTVAAYDDSSALEVGVRFTADVDGVVAGIRFWKGTGNNGTHRGTLWTVDGQQLATGAFVSETASGWQTLLFDQPVQVSAGTSFVASYSSPTGHYAVDINAFAEGYDKPPLHVAPTGGLYRYGGGTAFPTATSNHNFWVDVYFIPGG
ncbi:DUF4082 domain-containing protein [Micromonospora sp. NPDC005173]|uniref:DUF4082 domain-containing protein n=1 Tax=Micromonospora sp. NPDC005173 TaxID=3157165 RepID=UPI0033AB6D6E